MDHEVGDTVYVLPAAEQGYLEKVHIKKIVVTNNELTHFQDHTLIYDTNNRRYFPDELVDLATAQAVIALVPNPPC